MASRRTSLERLDDRALNRALLARQRLLARSRETPLAMIEHLVGLQSQAPTPPYYALWARIEEFEPASLSALITERRAVRIAAMRGTVHLVSARDCLLLRPLTQPIFARSVATNPEIAPALVGVDLAALAALGRALVEERPRENAELRAELAARHPHRDATALARALRDLLPMVQVPPRGLWGESGMPQLTTAESWLGAPLDPAPSIDDVVLRYLAAFGPASVKDAQKWSGLAHLRDAFERLAPRLRAFEDARGEVLLDLPDAPRPDRDEEAPLRFMAEFDNVLLSFADPSRILSREHKKRVFTVNGLVRGTVLVDGMVAAIWRIERERRRATLAVEPFAKITRATRAAIEAEGARLLTFAARDGELAELRIAAPS